MINLSFMTFACPAYTFDQVLALALKHGYQGIEFRCDAQHRHGVEVNASPSQRAVWRRQLAEAGLLPQCLATSLQFVNERAVAETPARLDLAAELGCRGLRVFCGPLSEGSSIEQALPLVAQNLRAVADSALALGLDLWLETHDSVSLGQHAGRIVRLVDHPAVAINWDNMHPARNGEALEVTWQAIGPYVRHTHFHDAVARPGAPVIKPFGQGELPIQPMYDLLRGAGYTGFFSGEWFDTQMGADADASLAAFKSGLEVLEQGWQGGAVITQSPDTSEEAERVQIAILHRMPPWRKLQMLDSMVRLTRDLAMSGLRQRFPNDPDEVLRRRLADILLGEELATKVYGPSSGQEDGC